MSSASAFLGLAGPVAGAGASPRFPAAQFPHAARAHRRRGGAGERRRPIALAPQTPICSASCIACSSPACSPRRPADAAPGSAGRAGARRGADRAAVGLRLARPSTRPGLVWLGLGTQDPATLDWRPLMPWGGVLLLGLGAGAARAADARMAGAARALARRSPSPAGTAWRSI